MGDYMGRERARRTGELQGLAAFYRWDARHAPSGRDPRTGLPWLSGDPVGRAVHRAARYAAARAVLAHLRGLPPFPLP